MATVKLEGFDDVERALLDLTKSAGRGVMRRSLRNAAKPLKDVMKDMAPRGDTATDALAESVGMSSKLSPRQAAQHRRMFADDRASVELFVGAGPDPAAHNQEFGNVNHGAQPFVRPAWDQEAMPTLDRLGPIFWDEISKSLVRAQRKAARQG